MSYSCIYFPPIPYKSAKHIIIPWIKIINPQIREQYYNTTVQYMLQWNVIFMHFPFLFPYPEPLGVGIELNRKWDYSHVKGRMSGFTLWARFTAMWKNRMTYLLRAAWNCDCAENSLPPRALKRITVLCLDLSDTYRLLKPMPHAVLLKTTNRKPWFLWGVFTSNQKLEALDETVLLLLVY